MKDKSFYERCRCYFGEYSEEVVAVEECTDLIKAITDNWRNRCCKEKMVDAISDVLNIVEQLVYNFDLEKDVEKVRQDKLKRIEEKIEKVYF